MEAVIRTHVAALAVTVLAIAACAKQDGATGDATAATKRMGTSDTAGSLPSSPATPTGWSDANIFALLDEANAGDSTEGAIAATKATSAQVREFGKKMMADHHAMRLEVQALAKKLAITPTPAADDDGQAGLQKNTDMLNSTAKGKDFDKAYIDLQVEDHKGVLEKAIKSMAATQNAELKNLLQKAAPKVQAHLDGAEAIQKSMK